MNASSMQSAENQPGPIFDVTDIEALPPLPATAMKIMMSFDDEYLDGNQIAEIIADDPAICARFLGVANSSYFNLREPVVDIRDVVTRVLGVENVRTMAFALAMQQCFDTSRCPNFDSGIFWEDALSDAESCQLLARQSTLTEDQRRYARTLGLCRELGLLALAALEPRRLDAVLAVHALREPRTSEILAQEFGVTIAAITASLAGKWSLPKPISDAYEAVASEDVTNEPMGALLLCIKSRHSCAEENVVDSAWLEALGLEAIDVARLTEDSSSKAKIGGAQLFAS